jgi:hypothetical protein
LFRLFFFFGLAVDITPRESRLRVRLRGRDSAFGGPITALLE